MLSVPHRSGGGFPLMADTLEEKIDWVQALRSVISRGEKDRDSLDDKLVKSRSSSSSSSSSSGASSS